MDPANLYAVPCLKGQKDIKNWVLKRQKRWIEEMERTSESLRGRIAELETYLPIEVTAGKTPYVGHKQLIIGRSTDPEDGANSTALPFFCSTNASHLQHLLPPGQQRRR